MSSDTVSSSSISSAARLRAREQPLLGRAVETLSKAGAEALSAAARAVTLEDTNSLGAQYAVCAGIAELAENASDVLEVLALLECWYSGRGGVGSLARERLR